MMASCGTLVVLGKLGRATNGLKAGEGKGRSNPDRNCLNKIERIARIERIEP
jgi:hypothetical protein